MDNALVLLLGWIDVFNRAENYDKCTSPQKAECLRFSFHLNSKIRIAMVFNRKKIKSKKLHVHILETIFFPNVFGRCPSFEKNDFTFS